MAQESGTLQDRFDATVAGLASGGGRFLLAVSGGVDSMTMARLFVDSSLAIPFSVAHVNFSLRGEESDKDQRLVEQWCCEHGVELFVKRVDTVSYARERGLSIEMAARELRYSWFSELCSSYGFDYVAVAHNLNDSAETMVLNLLRGSGVRGLCGISFLNGNIVRPMLQFSREEIEAYASSHEVRFRTDSTNGDSAFSRNRIRNEVFPHFKRINPSFLETLRVEAQRFSVVEDILASELSSREGSLYRRSGDTLLIDLDALSLDPHAGYWLFRLLHPFGFNSAQILQISQISQISPISGTKTSEIVPEKAGIAMSGTKTSEIVPERAEIAISGTKMAKIVPEKAGTAGSGTKTSEIVPEKAGIAISGTKMAEIVPEKAGTAGYGTKTSEIVPENAEIAGSGTKTSEIVPERGTGKRFESESYMALIDRGFLKVFPKSSLHVGNTDEYVPSETSEPVACTALDKPDDFDPKQAPEGVLFVDADKVAMPLTVRPPRQGERFRPLGLKGSKLLSDLFTDLKLDMRQKCSARVICDASGSIVCVAPYRIADSCRVTDSTLHLLQIATKFGRC